LLISQRQNFYKSRRSGRDSDQTTVCVGTKTASRRSASGFVPP